jgi:hypothetical protein
LCELLTSIQEVIDSGAVITVRAPQELIAPTSGWPLAPFSQPLHKFSKTRVLCTAKGYVNSDGRHEGLHLLHGCTSDEHFNWHTYRALLTNKKQYFESRYDSPLPRRGRSNDRHGTTTYTSCPNDIIVEEYSAQVIPFAPVNASKTLPPFMTA